MTQLVRRNPGGHIFGTRLGTLRWRLVLWLTGGTIEAVPIGLRSGIRSTEAAVIRLGQPGALNTVERKHD